MNTLIIRRSKNKDLILSCNNEKVYRLFRFGQEIDNDIDYDRISDQFDEMDK